MELTGRPAILPSSLSQMVWSPSSEGQGLHVAADVLLEVLQAVDLLLGDVAGGGDQDCVGHDGCPFYGVRGSG
ncbi:hypothetical protein AUV02_05380 [Micrococcus sp. CH3]|nr:hypothetical protein AUV02_05380 [Micrococcus sp. CH3]